MALVDLANVNAMHIIRRRKISMKSIQVCEDNWRSLCGIKLDTCAHSIDEIISRLLKSHRSAVLHQKSLLKEGEKYES